MISDLHSIKAKIKLYVLQVVYAENYKIQYHTLIFKDGYFDSMGFMRLITWIEKEFNIKTNDKDLTEENFESINAIASFVGRKLKLSLCAE
jgi:acyl carrier protein